MGMMVVVVMSGNMGVVIVMVCVICGFLYIVIMN